RLHVGDGGRAVGPGTGAVGPDPVPQPGHVPGGGGRRAPVGAPGNGVAPRRRPGTRESGTAGRGQAPVPGRPVRLPAQQGVIMASQTEAAWRLPLAAGGLAAVALAGVVLLAVIDFLTPANVILPLLYGVPLLALGPLRSRALLWGTALACALATFAAYFWGSPPAVLGVQTVALVNRA